MIDIQNVPKFYQGYVRTLDDDELIPHLLNTGNKLTSYGEKLNENQGNYRYETDKWSIKEVIQHITDSERIFAYRAIRFARNDATELSGFEQNDYVVEAESNNRNIRDLITEFANVRVTTIDLFSSFKEEVKKRSGIASGVNISVEALGYIIAGHCNHHLNILAERYIK